MGKLYTPPPLSGHYVDSKVLKRVKSWTNNEGGKRGKEGKREMLLRGRLGVGVKLRARYLHSVLILVSL